MEIKTTTEDLFKHKLTISQYIFLKMLLYDVDLLIEYVKNTRPFPQSEIEDLMTRGYVIYPETAHKDIYLFRDNMHPTMKSKALFEDIQYIKEELPKTPYEAFDIFWEAYPKKRLTNESPLRVKKDICSALFRGSIIDQRGQVRAYHYNLFIYAVDRMAKAATQKFDPTPTTINWLKGQRWEDYREDYNEYLKQKEAVVQPNQYAIYKRGIDE